MVTPEPVEPAETANHQEDANSIFTILEPGSIFQGYTILSLKNKDPEGFKYIAEKNGKKYFLKVFYQSSFSSMDHLYQQQMRLSRISKIRDPHTARVAEVNLVNKPSYMAAEFVEGKSLAQIKALKPDEPQEDFICKHIPTLIKTAENIRKHGLTIAHLTLHGIMIDNNDQLVILSSGIDYEEVDEREDVFVIGVIIAQFLATNGLYKTIYSQERLRVTKFAYVNGVTLSLNKLLAECLHRNILQRVTNLHSLLKAYEGLPEINEDSVWLSKDKPKATVPEAQNEVPKPGPRFEYGFIILIIGIVAALVITMIFLFGGKIGDAGPDNVNPKGDSLQLETRVIRDTTSKANEPVVTGYGDYKQLSDNPGGMGTSLNPTPVYSGSSRTQEKRVPIPANMVRIDKGTVAFGRLEDNTNIVSISPFYISMYELTQAEWNKYMRPANVSTPGDRLPVDNVTWKEIIGYCNKRSDDEGLERVYTQIGNVISANFGKNGYRLPTEAEWEFAAKSGMTFSYSGSDDPDDVAWYKANSSAKIHPVGLRSPNGNGLYDMTGNVAEWVWDWYDSSLSLTSYSDPTGPKSGSQKVIRGGSALNGEGRSLNIVTREARDPERRFPYVGVRLVRSR